MREIGPGLIDAADWQRVMPLVCRAANGTQKHGGQELALGLRLLAARMFDLSGDTTAVQPWARSTQHNHEDGRDGGESSAWLGLRVCGPCLDNRQT